MPPKTIIESAFRDAEIAVKIYALRSMVAGVFSRLLACGISQLPDR